MIVIFKFRIYQLKTMTLIINPIVTCKRMF